MLLVNEDTKPEATVYYTACCVLEVLKDRVQLPLDDLYTEVAHRYNKALDYSTLVLSVDFLFLIDKVKTNREMIICT